MKIVRVSKRFIKVSLISLAAMAFAVFLIQEWLIPKVLVARIESLTGGKAEIKSWWIGGQSAGIVGLRLLEGRPPGAKAFANAATITTDLSWGALLRGRFVPRRITLRDPEIVLHFDEKGQLLSTLGTSGAGVKASSRIPTIIVQGGTVTFQQDGRPDMVVKQLTARLDPESNGIGIAARTGDPRWGSLQAFGHFSKDFTTGKLDLKSVGRVTIDAQRVRSIPFVPTEVWENILPEGEVKIEAKIERRAVETHSIHLETRIELLGTSLRSPSLDLDAKRSSGLVTIHDSLVTLKNVGGLSLGGKVAADGTLDFEASPPKVDLKLVLNSVEVADAPQRWQLGKAGVVGRLTGSVHLIGLLKPTGIDLTGSSGDGTVVNGTIQGIPFKSIKLAMKANGDDLQYETPKADEGKPPEASRGKPFPRDSLQELLLISLQAPAIPKDEPPAPVPTVSKPRSITTQLEFEDVDLEKIIARAQVILRTQVPIPITGRFSIKAEATIPIGRLQDVKAYAFHGDLKLTRASIEGVDIGRIDARMDLADGLLELKNLRGVLSDKPNGGVENPPKLPASDVSIEGPLPAGGFRGSVHAELSPLGRLKAKFEGNELPLGELTAPMFPRPTPLSGFSTMNIEAEADLANVMQPEAWIVRRDAKSRSIRYESAMLQEFSSHFVLKDGRFEFNDSAAIMDGKPLKGRASLFMKTPQAFESEINVNEWGIASIFKWIPNLPPKLLVSGTLSGSAKLSGTLRPLKLTTLGKARLHSFQADSIAFGDLSLTWKTLQDVIHVELVDHQSTKGGFKANGDIPLTGDDPIKGSLDIKDFDTRRINRLLQAQSLDLSGRVDGKGTFTIPKGTPAIDADLKLSSKTLIFRGLPTEHVQIQLLADKMTLRYKLKAESLGGTFSLNGELPMFGESTTRDNEPNGVFQTVNFQVEPIWKAIGLTGPLSQIQGRGAIDANLRASIVSKPHFLARGIAEFRDLRWGTKKPAAIGLLKGVVELSPETWRLDPVVGTILGGQISGSAWGTIPEKGPASRRFDLKLDHASIARIQHLAPSGWPVMDGHATIRLAGTSEEMFRAELEVTIPRATVEGIRVSEMKFPATLVTDPSGKSGVVQLRHWSARLAGGTVRGDSMFRIGESQAFRSECQIAALDLESIVRMMSDVRRPASGKISGRVSVQGAHPNRPKSYRGEFDFDLDDASLVALPIFREIDKFLGSARGGLFEHGDLSGNIADGRFNIDSFALEGRIAQLQTSGTVGFDGRLDLEVLVNTSQLIPQTGKALVALIPGLSNFSNRGRNATAQFAGFLSNKLLKLRVAGTLRNPAVSIDPSVGVSDAAVSFFGGIMKLPLGLLD